MASSVPFVKITYNRYTNRIRCPHSKIYAINTIFFTDVCSEILIYVVAYPSRKSLKCFIVKYRTESVWVLHNICIFAFGYFELVTDFRLGNRSYEDREKSLLIHFVHPVLFFAADYGTFVGRRNKAVDHPATFNKMGSQILMGVILFRVNYLLNPCPIHHLIKFLVHNTLR